MTTYKSAKSNLKPYIEKLYEQIKNDHELDYLKNYYSPIANTKNNEDVSKIMENLQKEIDKHNTNNKE